MPRSAGRAGASVGQTDGLPWLRPTIAGSGTFTANWEDHGKKPKGGCRPRVIPELDQACGEQHEQISHERTGKGVAAIPKSRASTVHSKHLSMNRRVGLHSSFSRDR